MNPYTVFYPFIDLCESNPSPVIQSIVVDVASKAAGTRSPPACPGAPGCSRAGCREVGDVEGFI